MSETLGSLSSKRCVPCEGGVPPLSAEEIAGYLTALPRWKVVGDGKRIRREWRAKNFLAAIRFFDEVARIAEAEGHHPDLHLERYRDVAIELWTHAIDGLSENDVILAAKVEAIDWDRKERGA